MFCHHLHILPALAGVALITITGCRGSGSAIDRRALVDRNSPHITAIDTLASLSVGNGEFAVTVDVTGLQTFPTLYASCLPLVSQSQLSLIHI